MVRRATVVLTVVGLLAGGLVAGSAPAVAAPVASSSDLPGGTYVPVAPARLLDTRQALGAPGGVTTRVDLAVTGRGGVPTVGVAAVVLNVTVTGPVDAGWLAVSPVGTSTSSNLNYVRGQDVAQLVTSKLDAAGHVVVTSSVRTQVVADVVGWFSDSAHTAAGATYRPATPRRLFDSRLAGSGGPMLASAPRRIALTDVPAGTTAVAVNLTSVSPSTNVFVAAWGSGGWPGTSSMNVATGDIRSNRAIVPVANGAITVMANLGRSDLVVDLSGWFTGGSAAPGGSRFVPLDPARLGDTRDSRSHGAIFQTAYRPLDSTIAVAGEQLGDSDVTLPPSDALVRPTAAWLSVTVVSPGWTGWLALAPTRGGPDDPQTTPGSSDVNFFPGVTPNAVLATLGDGGRTSTTTNASYGPAGLPDPGLVVDIAGIFVQTPSPAPGLWQQVPRSSWSNPGGQWIRPVAGDWGDVVEVTGGNEVAVLRRDGTVLRANGSPRPQVVTTDAVHVVSGGGGVFVVKRDGTVWTDSTLTGAHGVPGSVQGFAPVTGATSVVSVKPVYPSSTMVARRTDGSVITWGGETSPAVHPLTWTGSGNLDMSFDAGTNCIVHGDGSVEVVSSGRASGRSTGIDARAVVSALTSQTACIALGGTGRVHFLRLETGSVTDAVIDGPRAIEIVAGRSAVGMFDDVLTSHARILTADGTVQDLVFDWDADSPHWQPVPVLRGATVIGGGFSLVTWVPPTR